MATKAYFIRQREEVLKYLKQTTEIVRHPIMCRILATRLPYSAKILEAGCREGRGIKALMVAGFKSVCGLELVWDAVQVARDEGFIVDCGDMHDMKIYEDESFNAVVMNHSLEHCYDPLLVLNNVYRILVSKGLVYIDVPGKPNNNCGGNRQQILNGLLHEVDFNTKQITNLLTEAGFKIIYYNVQSWRSALIFIGEKL